MLIGTEGPLLIVHASGLALLPSEKYENYKKPKFPERNHYYHFVIACSGRVKLKSYYARTSSIANSI